MAQYVGTVIGTKMDKTAKVLVTRMVLYRKLRKVRLDNNLKFECQKCSCSEFQTEGCQKANIHSLHVL